MAIEPIKNDEDHKAALVRIEALWNAEPGSADFHELKALAAQVEHYEEKRWPLATLRALRRPLPPGFRFDRDEGIRGQEQCSPWHRSTNSPGTD